MTTTGRAAMLVEQRLWSSVPFVRALVVTLLECPGCPADALLSAVAGQALLKMRRPFSSIPS